MVERMTEKPTPERATQRQAWDAAYREKNRTRRREYDRERMRQIRQQAQQ